MQLIHSVSPFPAFSPYFFYKRIKLFLAFGDELRDDAQVFLTYLQSLNNHLVLKNLFIEATAWTTSTGPFTQEPKQNTFNHLAATSDILLILIHTQIGEGTMAEFNDTYKAFKKNPGQLKIYVYFKYCNPIPPEIIKFKKIIDNDKQYYGDYTNSYHLCKQMGEQLEIKLDKIYYKRRKKRKIFIGILIVIISMITFFCIFLLRDASHPRSLLVKTYEAQEHNLPFQKAELILSYGDKEERQYQLNIHDVIIFNEIPTKYWHKPVNLKYKAYGYQEIDTTFKLSDKLILSLYRDQSYSKIQGTVCNFRGELLKGVTVTMDTLAAMTDSLGRFCIRIPLESQKKEQRIMAYKAGYQLWEITSSPSDKSNCDIVLNLLP